MSSKANFVFYIFFNYFIFWPCACEFVLLPYLQLFSPTKAHEAVILCSAFSFLHLPAKAYLCFSVSSARKRRKERCSPLHRLHTQITKAPLCTDFIHTLKWICDFQRTVQSLKHYWHVSSSIHPTAAGKPFNHYGCVYNSGCASVTTCWYPYVDYWLGKESKRCLWTPIHSRVTRDLRDGGEGRKK